MKEVQVKREAVGVIVSSDDHWIEPTAFLGEDEELGEYTDAPEKMGGSWIVNRLSLVEVEVKA